MDRGKIGLQSTRGARVRSRAAGLLIAMSVGALNGCAWWTGEFSADEVIESGARPDMLGLKERVPPVDLKQLRFLGDRTDNLKREPGEGPLAYALASPGKPGAKVYRDRLQAHVLRVSDRICEGHKAAIVADQAGINLLADVANLGVSAAGAVLTGGSSRLMSAISAAVVGTRASFNENVYQKYIAPAVTKRIDIDRQEIRLEIEGKRVNPPEVYTVDDALFDAQRYHLKCSFYSGLSSLAAEGQKTAEEKASIDAIIKADNLRVTALDGEIAQLDEAAKKATSATDRASIDASKKAKQRLKNFLLARIDILTRAASVR